MAIEMNSDNNIYKSFEQDSNALDRSYKNKDKNFISGIRISGYASVFNLIDKDSDNVKKGAFSKDINNIKDPKREVKLLLEHDTSSTIGYIEDIFEDDYGLFITGVILRTSPELEKTINLIRNKNLSGLSVGYIVREKNVIDNVRQINQASLIEISVVNLPVNSMSQIIKVEDIFYKNNDSQKDLALKELQSARDVNNLQSKNIAGSSLDLEMLNNIQVDKANKSLDFQTNNISQGNNKAKVILDYIDTPFNALDLRGMLQNIADDISMPNRDIQKENLFSTMQKKLKDIINLSIKMTVLIEELEVKIR